MTSKPLGLTEAPGYPPLRITLLGCGKMGLALLRGWLEKGLTATSIQVIEPQPSPALVDLASRSGCLLRRVQDASPSDVVVIAVKPQAISAIAASCGGLFAADAVLISIMAGTTLATLGHLFGFAAARVRTMPNLAAMAGKSATVLVADATCSENHRRTAESLMAAVGSTQWLPSEAMMDAACALSGSGPAYAFYLVECLAQAGVKEGLPPEVAARLARATLIGAGAVLGSGTAEPEDLRMQVTSPGGTTQAGLSVLMGDGVLSDLLDRTMSAAAHRSRELGRPD